MLVDADHLFALPRYISDNGWEAILRPTWDDGSGLVWKSWFHYPIGAAIVAPLAIGWRFMLPLLFWSIHIGTDYLQIATRAHSALIESAVLACACAGIFAFGYVRWREMRESGSIREYVAHIRWRVAHSLTRSVVPVPPPRDST